jgi:hypothetical protein
MTTYQEDVLYRCQQLELYCLILVVLLFTLTVMNVVSVDTLFSVWFATSFISCLLTYVKTGRLY